MVRNAHQRDSSRPKNGYRVEVPQAYDAIGAVLRDTYERPPEIPADMAGLLRRLSEHPQMNR